VLCEEVYADAGVEVTDAAVVFAGTAVVDAGVKTIAIVADCAVTAVEGGWEEGCDVVVQPATSPASNRRLTILIYKKFRFLHCFCMISQSITNRICVIKDK